MRNILRVSGYLALGLLLAASCQKTRPTPRAGEEAKDKPKQEQKADGETVNQSFTGLAALGRSLECDWSFTLPSSSAVSVGKVWTAGGKSRSQVQLGSTGGEVNGIFKDGKVYTWTQLSAGIPPIAFTFDATATGTAASLTEEQKAKAAEYQKNANYRCKAWTPDSAKFELPAGINFSGSLNIQNMAKDILKNAADLKDIKAKLPAGY